MKNSPWSLSVLLLAGIACVDARAAEEVLSDAYCSTIGGHEHLVLTTKVISTGRGVGNKQRQYRLVDGQRGRTLWEETVKVGLLPEAAVRHVEVVCGGRRSYLVDATRTPSGIEARLLAIEPAGDLGVGVVSARTWSNEASECEFSGIRVYGGIGGVILELWRQHPCAPKVAVFDTALKSWRDY